MGSNYEQTENQKALEQSVDPDLIVRHSGQLSEEEGRDAAEDRFDKTDLETAVKKGLVSDIEEHHPVLDTEPQTLEETKNRKWLKPVVLGLGTIGIAIFGITQLSDKDESATDLIEIEEPEAGSATTVTDRSSPTTNERAASIDQFNLETVPLGDDYITAVRPNGEEIRVGRLRGETPNQIASSALNLMACYFTTGDEQCLDALTSGEDTRAFLINWRQADMVPVFESPNGQDAQLVIIERASDPVSFRHEVDDSGYDAIVLERGTLFFGRAVNTFGGSNEWQSSDFAMFDGLEQTFDSLRLVYAPRGDELTILGIDYNLSLTTN